MSEATKAAIYMSPRKSGKLFMEYQRLKEECEQLKVKLAQVEALPSAEQIADAILSANHAEPLPASRIALKLADPDDRSSTSKERNLGGLNRSALTEVIEKALTERKA